MKFRAKAYRKYFLLFAIPAILFIFMKRPVAPTLEEELPMYLDDERAPTWYLPFDFSLV